MKAQNIRELHMKFDAYKTLHDGKEPLVYVSGELNFRNGDKMTVKDWRVVDIGKNSVFEIKDRSRATYDAPLTVLVGDSEKREIVYSPTGTFTFFDK